MSEVLHLVPLVRRPIPLDQPQSDSVGNRDGLVTMSSFVEWEIKSRGLLRVEFLLNRAKFLFSPLEGKVISLTILSNIVSLKIKTEDGERVFPVSFVEEERTGLLSQHMAKPFLPNSFLVSFQIENEAWVFRGLPSSVIWETSFGPVELQIDKTFGAYP